MNYKINRVGSMVLW